MKKKFIKIIFLFSLVISLTYSFQALAWSWSNITGFSKTSAGEAGLTQTDFALITAKVITTILALVGALFVILFIYGGFNWLTSAGSEEKIGKAKKTLTYAVIGVVIIGTAYSITSFIARGIFTGTTTTAPSSNPTAGSQCQGVGGVCTTYDNCVRTLQGSSAGILDCGTQICCQAAPSGERADCSGCSGERLCSKSGCESIDSHCHWHALPYPYCNYDPNYDNTQ